MEIIRYLEKQIKLDLKSKMVFLGGPRQVGKTYLSKKFITDEEQYLNWDLARDKKLLLSDKINTSLGLIVIDELHKYKFWRNFLKGYFDKFYPKLNFLITGSAKLDYIRKGGDSLVGRYHYLRLHPISLMEISQNPNSKDLQNLLNFSGYSLDSI